MAVLHLLRKRIPDVPVLFLDTAITSPKHTNTGTGWRRNGR